MPSPKGRAPAKIRTHELYHRIRRQCEHLAAAQEVAYLRKFASSRRMDCARGPYFVDGSGPFGQGHDDDIHAFNKPPAGQPGLWCQREPTKDGTAIKWNGVEKFYNSEAWMSYL